MLCQKFNSLMMSRADQMLLLLLLYCYCIGSNLADQMSLLLEAIRLIKCVSMTLVLNTMGRDFTDKALLHFINTLLALLHLHRAAFQPSATKCTKFFQVFTTLLGGGTQEVIVNRVSICQNGNSSKIDREENTTAKKFQASIRNR